MKTAGQPLLVRHGKGAHLELEDGRKIVDCISSWWVNLHGHGNADIAKAIYDQALELEHVIFAGFTHSPAIELATSLIQVLDNQFTRVFFSDNGSTSVEVALKMAYQYWKNCGQQQRKRFIGFDGGYHGDTIGAMSLGGSSEFWTPFAELLFPIDVVPYPQTWESDTNREMKETESLSSLRQLFESNRDQYAAVIIEPLVQGAAGMRMCSTQFLASLKTLCKEFNVLLIFDEVMTGFGRTGDWFACKKANVYPDIVCLSKGITGGFMPLSVTVCTEKVYQAFYDDKLERALFHSHSYTGNPLACAAANASMKLTREAEPTFRAMEQSHRRLNKKWLDDTKFHQQRFCGTIAAFDVKVDSEVSYFDELGPRLRREFINAGLLLRPLGSTIYLMPPYCIGETLLEDVYKQMSEVLETALQLDKSFSASR